MNLFFEESGDFKAGAVLAQQGEAYQVETPTGKPDTASLLAKIGLPKLIEARNLPVGAIFWRNSFDSFISEIYIVKG